MKLLTKEIEAKLPPLYSTEETPTSEKIAIVKFFTPRNMWIWYGVEYDPKEKLFFGLVYGIEKEWGYFSLDELEGLNSQPSRTAHVERDISFKPTKISDIERREHDG